MPSPCPRHGHGLFFIILLMTTSPPPPSISPIGPPFPSHLPSSLFCLCLPSLCTECLSPLLLPLKGFRFPHIYPPPIHRHLSSFIHFAAGADHSLLLHSPQLIFPKMSFFLCPLSLSRSLFVLLSLLLSLPSPLSSQTYYVKAPFEGRFKTAHEKWICELDGYDLSTEDMDRTCDENDENDKAIGQIFCYGKILEAINYFGKYTMFNEDFKHIVDRPLKKSAAETVADFKRIFGVEEWKDFKVSEMNVTTVATLKTFVREHFGNADKFLDSPQPVDWKENPPKLQNIADPQLKTFANQLHGLWKKLGKKMPESAKENKSTLIYVPNPFVVPGGRFREFYYWDAYWIVRGLLASGMTESVKHMCNNYAEMVNKFGFVPNGGRIYYNKRSQPPFLTFMVNDYFAETGDTEYLKTILPVLEKELDFWRTKFGGKSLRLLSRDGTSARNSARWMEEDKNGANETLKWKMTRLMITKIVPVDLNALICGNLEMLSNLYHQIGDKEKANSYHKEFQAFREDDLGSHSVLEKDVHELFYEDGGWFDFNLNDQKQNTRFYGSIVVPLFTRCYRTADVEETEKLLDKLEHFNNTDRILSHEFGVATSAIASGQQWDFPNIWPPLAHMMIEGLRRSGIKRMEDKAKEMAQQWVSANHKLYNTCRNYMFEKTTADNGAPGGGGEYNVQIGFGWSNGGILDLLVTYGKEMKVKKLREVECSVKEVVEEPDEFP